MRRTLGGSFERRFGMNTRRILGLTLVIVAIGVAIVLRSSADSTAKPGDVNEARILSDAATGNNWMVNGRTNDSKHFSPLKQINDQNVGNLGLAWYLDYDGAMGIVSEPIVVDGVIYVSAPLSKVYAVEASTGKLLWKYDPQIRLDQALNGSYSARTNGGVAVWNGKVYVGTGDCRLIAIDAATAKKIWEASVCEPLQTGITGAPRVAKGKIFMGYNGSEDAGPENVHNENNQIMMADLAISGEKRHVVLTAPKNGFFYILDAKTGKLLSAKPLAKTTWATSYDLQTAKPVLIPASQGGGRQWTVHNWWPMSYSSLTGLVYIPATDRRSDTKAAVEAGESGEGLFGKLIAWDPVAETARWSVEEEISVNGGVFSTAGNLVFQGQGTGEFAAYAADTGKKLWAIQTKSAIESIPVTFSVNGEQYVITSVGWGSGSRLFAPARTMATPESKRGPNRLYAFKLGGKVPFPTPHIEIPPVPKPPDQKVSEEIVRKGEKIYVSFYCEGCHSPFIDGSGAWVEDGAIPDLRYAPPEVHKDWYGIVLGGSHWSKGMPGLADPPKFAFPKAHMTVAEADSVHAYVIDQA